MDAEKSEEGYVAFLKRWYSVHIKYENSIYLAMIFILAATVISGGIAYAQNVTNSTNLLMNYNLTSPVIHPPIPQLVTINVTFNKTGSGSMVIVGTVHILPSRPVVLTIKSPQNNL